MTIVPPVHDYIEFLIALKQSSSISFLGVQPEVNVKPKVPEGVHLPRLNSMAIFLEIQVRYFS